MHDTAENEKQDVTREYDEAGEITRRFLGMDPRSRERALDKMARTHMAMGVQGAFAGEGGQPVRTEERLGTRTEELSLDNIEDAMKYQPWNREQTARGDQVREALVLAAKAILRNAPRSPRRTLALQHLIDARMDTNAAISFNGRF